MDDIAILNHILKIASLQEQHSKLLISLTELLSSITERLLEVENKI